MVIVLSNIIQGLLRQLPLPITTFTPKSALFSYILHQKDCSVLMLVEFQAPIKASLSLPSTTGLVTEDDSEGFMG